MLKGFYDLTSGMLTQARVLNTISNNISNASTPGFKSDKMVTNTFREMLLYRTGNTNKRGTTPLAGTNGVNDNNHGSESMILTVNELITNHNQGTIEPTDRDLDFCILGNGFFQIQKPNGDLVYTRNGSFTLDDDGYLYLQHIGRVMGENGPIRLDTDRIILDNDKRIIDENGNVLGRILIADFNDYDQLLKVEEGMFASRDGTPLMPDIINPAETDLINQSFERSNVDPIDEMTGMMTSQRSLQSAAQLLKMYDTIMAKAVSEIGRV